MCWGRHRSGSNIAARCGSSPAITNASMIRPACRLNWSAATRSSPNAPLACRSFAGAIRKSWRLRSTTGGGRMCELERTSLLLAYTLGKSQHVLSLLDPSIGPILLHGATHAMVEAYRASGVSLPPAEHASARRTQSFTSAALGDRAAVGAGVAMGAEVFAGLRWHRIGLDADPRNSPAAQRRSRLRDFRSCRLAGADADD